MQGLKFLLSGVVVAHGGSHHRGSSRAQSGKRLGAHSACGKRGRHHQADDYRGRHSRAITEEICGCRSPAFQPISEQLRGDRVGLKDLWESDGQVGQSRPGEHGRCPHRVDHSSRRGNSGGPLYGDFNGQKHIVIGMHKASAATASMSRKVRPMYSSCLRRTPWRGSAPLKHSLPVCSIRRGFAQFK